MFAPRSSSIGSFLPDYLMYSIPSRSVDLRQQALLIVQQKAYDAASPQTRNI